MSVEEVGNKIGHWLYAVMVRLVTLKVGWWGFGLEGWCGLPLPWGAAMFFALLTVRPRLVKNYFVLDSAPKKSVLYEQSAN